MLTSFESMNNLLHQPDRTKPTSTMALILLMSRHPCKIRRARSQTLSGPPPAFGILKHGVNAVGRAKGQEMA
jgi:hypothetical protein